MRPGYELDRFGFVEPSTCEKMKSSKIIQVENLFRVLGPEPKSIFKLRKCYFLIITVIYYNCIEICGTGLWYTHEIVNILKVVILFLALGFEPVTI